MNTRNDRRMRSIRSLPQGQFVKFLEMFNSRNDSTKKATNTKKSSTSSSTTSSSSTPIIDDKSNLIYEEINNLDSSDQTNEDDKEVEYILGCNTNSNPNNKSEIIYSNESSNSSNDLNFRNVSSSFTNNINNPMFHGVSDETKTLLKSICSSNEEIATFLGENNEKTNLNNNCRETMQVKRCPNEYNWYQAIPVRTVDDDYNQNKNLENISYIESTSDSFEEYGDGKNQISNLNDIEFSDDSYDETDNYSNHGYEVKLNVLRLQEKEEECNTNF